MGTKIKELQSAIIGCAKTNDVTRLTTLMEEVRSFSHQDDKPVDLSDLCKTAINISANITCLQDTSVGSETYESLHRIVNSLLVDYPRLRELENVEYSLVKIKLMCGDVESAVEIAHAFKAPRLRMFSVILEYCGSHHTDCDLAFTILHSIKSHGLVPTEIDFANMIKSLVSVSDFSLWSEYLGRILTSMDESDIHAISSPVLISSLVESFKARHLLVHQDVLINGDQPDYDLLSDSLSICPISGVKLDKSELSSEELSQMLTLTRQLSVEAFASNGERNFDSVFEGIFGSDSKSSPSVIIDGANVAHTNQNYAGACFRFDQIQGIVDAVDSREACFRSDQGIAYGSPTLIVLHEKWLSPTKDLRLNVSSQQPPKKKRGALPQLGDSNAKSEVFSEVAPPPMPHVAIPDALTVPDPEAILPPGEMITRWQAEGKLLIVPHKQNDDWFWLHACCLAIAQRLNDPPEYTKSSSSGLPVMLVSNDLMRDHYWRMRNPKSFAKFVANHVCRFEVKMDEAGINSYSLRVPTHHSVRIQRHGNWVHVPILVGEQGGQSFIKWMVFEMVVCDTPPSVS